MIFNNLEVKVIFRVKKWGVLLVLLNYWEYKNWEKFDSKIVKIL